MSNTLESDLNFIQDFLLHLNLPYLLSKWDNLIPVTALILLYVMALIAVCHILLIKRDPRAALGWIVACLGFPGIGVVFYILFGVNRIRTRAKTWQNLDRWGLSQKLTRREKSLVDLSKQHDIDIDTFRSLVHVSDSVTRRPLMKGCRLRILHNGEEAYPEMLAAIESATTSVYLCTYIFENNISGRKFAEALGRAAKRGVDVKIIVDGFGMFYSFPTIFGYLKRLGVNAVKFLPPSLSKRSMHLNLRNHRKILVVDQTIGFTGGMNIGDTHCVLREKKGKRAYDFQFKVEGPVVSHLIETFFEDWYFVTGEKPSQDIVYDSCQTGTALCRGVTAGPNEDFEQLRWIVNGAILSAKKNVRIMTPYFIPDTAMITALITAKLKGVEVELILPQMNNLFYVGWASQAYLEEFLRYGIKIHYRPSPFAHSKILIIDDFFTLMGSANLDTRSLRLNFEFNMEVYDKTFAHDMTAHFNRVRSDSRALKLEDMVNRPLMIKLRDAFAKLFAPYL
jgi:cardiolipin synthase